jgi:hypothetical protein
MSAAANKFQTHAREEFVAEMRCKGYTVRRIAQEIAKPENSHLWNKKTGKPIPFITVQKICERIRERYKANTQISVETLKQEHTAILERSITDLRDEFERSRQAQVMQKKKTSEAGAGNATKPGFVQNEIGQKTMIGDHSILNELRQHLADIRKIWGADAPIKTESLLSGSMQVTGQDLSSLSDEELETLRALQQKISAGSKALPSDQTAASSEPSV